MSNKLNAPLNRKLRMALLGGGSGFIGRVHATAATMDHRAELVAGVFSSDPAKSKAAAPSFGVADARAYGSYHELLDAESALPAEARIDFVSIATPNHTHFEIARAALATGFHVVCDKPMTTRVDDALELARLVEEQEAVFALTHNYTGYPMIRQAREMIAGGELGEIQAVRASYVQGWLCNFEVNPNAPRGVWKSDPEKAGSGSLGDIGTHAFNLVEFVTGLQPRELSAVMTTYHPRRPLDDYGHVLLDFGENRLGAITFSQISHGRLNDFTLEVDGTKAAVSWQQEAPNRLVVRRTGKATQTYERHPAAEYMSASGKAACRIPGGHPEGFSEAFANVYQAAFDDMSAAIGGQPGSGEPTLYPSVHDGVAGVRFIAACLQSSDQRGVWVPVSS